MLFAALELEKDKKKKNIDQVFAYGQCVKAEQRARVGKWVCQVSKTAGMEVVHRDLRLRSTGHASP
jgi:nitrogen fixation protein FixH